HLAHGVAAMELHCHLADAKVEGNLLVETPACHLAEDLPFSRGEGGKALDDPTSHLSLNALRHIPGNAGTNRVQKGLVANWLGEEVDGTGLHGLHGHGNVAMAREEDHWFSIPAPGQLLLQVQSARAGHSDVED